ncbi:MAG: sensor histidine kinase [Planctomycetota bacterium]|jgi:C4-dicarboxylate-specific signal transduction histidine kinase
MKDLAAASAGQGALPRLAKAEADLESLRKELNHTHQLATLGTLTAGIAHEINNILTPILAYAQMAKSNPDDAELQAKARDRAIAGVESASRIIEAVLGFARTDEETGPANISTVIESSLACLGRAPERDGVALTVKADPDSQVRIQPLALQQVLLNLMLNALTALHGRRGELRIDVASRDDGMTQIRVADDGPGIPQALAKTLFDQAVGAAPDSVWPFAGASSRTPAARSRSPPGGLSRRPLQDPARRLRSSCGQLARMEARRQHDHV